MEPRFNEPLYNEVLGITNDFLYPSNSKIYAKEPCSNETWLQRTDFASPLTLCYIEVVTTVERQFFTLLTVERREDKVGKPVLNGSASECKLKSTFGSIMEK